MNLKFKIVRKFVWKVLTEDGLLKDPVNSWGDNLFSRYGGFENEEEAIEELERRSSECHREMVLLPVYERVIDWD